MKDKGEYLTKAQRKKKAAMEAKRAELIANGTIKADDAESDDDGPKKSQVVKNKKNKNKNQAK